MTKLQIDFMNGFETIRHNKEGELLTQKQIAEQARHNLATEQEAHRSNIANEGLQAEVNAINRMNAQTNAINAQTNILNYQEHVRTNKANESIKRDQNVINAINASASLRNAATNERNAATNARLADITDVKTSTDMLVNYRKASLLDAQTQHTIAQMNNIKFQNVNSFVNTAINGVKALRPLSK